jgi:hypothetical protein
MAASASTTLNIAGFDADAQAGRLICGYVNYHHEDRVTLLPRWAVLTPIPSATVKIAASAAIPTGN